MNQNLTGAWRLYVRTTVFLLAVLFSVGAAGHAIPSALPLMLLLTPGFSLLTGALVAVPSLASGGRAFALWMAAAYVFTFLAEATGVATGAIFGEYAYGPTLGWAWRGVPVIIAFNWVMVVNGAICMAGRIVPAAAGLWRPLAISLVTGLIAAAFDFGMEPAAIRLEYWTWAGGAVPPQNYVAWFGIAALAASVHPRQLRISCDLGTTGRLAGIYVLMQAVFFIVLRLLWRFEAA